MADCVIVGAGLIGMLTAQELAAGGMKVTVLERGQPARESSWAGGGILYSVSLALPGSGQ